MANVFLGSDVDCKFWEKAMEALDSGKTPFSELVIMSRYDMLSNDVTIQNVA